MKQFFQKYNLINVKGVNTYVTYGTYTLKMVLKPVN